MSKLSDKLIKVGESRPATEGSVSASPIYRSIAAKDGFPELDATTLYDLFTKSVAKFPKNKCLGHRPKDASGKVGPYVFQTYEEVGIEVANLASGLAAIGGEPKAKIGVLGANCPEWMIAMQACNRLNLACVPLYDSLGENAIEYIIDHSEAAVTFLSAAKMPQMLQALPKINGPLKALVYWGECKAEDIEAVKATKHKIFSFDEVKKMGMEAPKEPVPPTPDDLCTIMYTSGTTGDPKGVMLTHRGVISAVANAHFYCKHNKVAFNEKDAFLSYLPLAHIFDRVNEEFFLYMGGSIGYWQGDVNKLLDDIAALKPAMFVGVPRVFDRIYSKVMNTVQSSSFLKRSLFNWGLSRKMYFMKQGRPQAQASPFFDRLVFSKVAASLGGKTKAVVSGGAPLAAHVEDFLRASMCAPVVQGYGLTETGAASFIAGADVILDSATVGPPTPGTEFRLESVPEMNYDALDVEEPKGEVLIRSSSNFIGYYKDQKKTDEELTKDGWFHTGDIGAITKHGALKIIDRKKNIFKLSQGEYVAVEKVEAVYKKNLITEQVWVYGNSLKNSLIAVVVPAQDHMFSWASANGVARDMAKICADPRATAHVLAELVATGKAEKLKGFELIKAVHLEHAAFSIENDLLTPTFKLKRPQLQKKYQSVLDKLYASLKD